MPQFSLLFGAKVKVRWKVLIEAYSCCPGEGSEKGLMERHSITCNGVRVELW